MGMMMVMLIPACGWHYLRNPCCGLQVPREAQLDISIAGPATVQSHLSISNSPDFPSSRFIPSPTTKNHSPPFRRISQ